MYLQSASKGLVFDPLKDGNWKADKNQLHLITMFFVNCIASSKIGMKINIQIYFDEFKLESCSS